MLDFYVIDTNAPSVMAMKTCRDLNLVKIVMAVTEEEDAASQSIMALYADVFQGVGEYPGQCTFHVAPDVTDPHRPGRQAEG